MHRLKRSDRRSLDFWPGFVDAMASLLLVLIFVLSLLTVLHFFLNQKVSQKDAILDALNAQIAQLTQSLAFEEAESQKLSSTFESLRHEMMRLEAEKQTLTQMTAETEDSPKNGAQSEQTSLLYQDAQNHIALLNQQLQLLRHQIATLESALQISERRNTEKNARISDLGRRLNIALAQRIQELSEYRSEFFARLKEIITRYDSVEILGDRFVFQSEIFFDTGSAELNPSGKTELKKMSAILKTLEAEIPQDLQWVLRVDGHTDKRPIVSEQRRFEDNWALSTARALSVVRFLIQNGVSAAHLAAAGFGAHHPLDPGDTPQAYTKNRRIELRLTE